MTTQFNRHAQVRRVWFAPLTGLEATFDHGSHRAEIRQAEWSDLRASKTEFTEEQTGGVAKIKLDATVTDTSATHEAELATLSGVPGVVRMDYTDGSFRVVGSDEWPVCLSMKCSGNPAVWHMTLDTVLPCGAYKLPSL